MTNFCTLFDSNYLTRGLALYESLEKVCPSFHLYVVTFDNKAFEFLSNTNLPHLTPISLMDFEDSALLKIKTTRSSAEYCWTCTPSVILYCLNRYRLTSCVYIDADMIFYSDPNVLMEEMGDYSILLSEHRYTREYDQPNGLYCVQFVGFRKDARGMAALAWWRDRCIEWCYARLEDGKFGDQKYLDDWLERFEGVHVLSHPGEGIAPWNVQQYRIKSDNPLMMEEITSQREFHLVYYHFHGLKFYTDDVVSCSGSMYELDESVKNILYFSYIKRLLEIEDKLARKGVPFVGNGARTESPPRWRTFLQFIKERLVLLKIGNISIFQLRLSSFYKHYHFYRLEKIKKYGTHD